MEENNICPLCDRNIKIEPLQGKDAFEIHCETCGRFETSDFKYQQLEVFSSEEKAMLSSFVREINEFGNPEVSFLVFDHDEIKRIIDQYQKKTIDDKLKNLLRYIKKKTTFFGEEIAIDLDKDYPITYSINRNEFLNIINLSIYLDYLRGDLSKDNIQFVSLTIKGWEKYEEIKESGKFSKKCFIAMSCSKELREAYENGIKKAVEEAGYQPIFIEEKEHNEKICDLIIASIRECRFLIADVTGQRQNVYYEAGFAQGLNIEVIWTCRKDEIDKVHFDTRQYNHIVWEAPDDLKKKLLNRIKATII